MRNPTSIWMAGVSSSSIISARCRMAESSPVEVHFCKEDSVEERGQARPGQRELIIGGSLLGVGVSFWRGGKQPKQLPKTNSRKCDLCKQITK